MKIGDPVRARIPQAVRWICWSHRTMTQPEGFDRCVACGQPLRPTRGHKLVRGVVARLGEDYVDVRVGLRLVTVARSGIEVIRRRGERDLTIAQDRVLRQQVRELTSWRGNKLIAGRRS
jgi:hypothetical protein